MKVKLKVLQGKRAGKEVAIPLGKFLVGRSEQCNLRPNSDSISRQHCQISVKEDVVKVKDLGSRNGTFVNGEQIKSCILSDGDELRIGKMEFQVIIQAPVVVTDSDSTLETKAEASPDEDTRLNKLTAGENDDISAWLEDETDFDRGPDTRQFTMDLTKKSDLDDDAVTKELDQTANKAEPGKLPQLPVEQSDTSRDAAADMLKKFFNRR